MMNFDLRNSGEVINHDKIVNILSDRNLCFYVFVNEFRLWT